MMVFETGAPRGEGEREVEAGQFLVLDQIGSLVPSPCHRRFSDFNSSGLFDS